MNWVEKLAQQRDGANQERAFFGESASALWGSLKDGLKEARYSYHRKYDPKQGDLQIEYEPMTEEPYLQCMTREAYRGKYTKEKCRVTLQRDSFVIRAKYSAGPPDLLLITGHSKYGGAVLQHDGVEISVDRACELILRPILFDDLPEES